MCAKFWPEKAHGIRRIGEGLGPRGRLDILEKQNIFRQQIVTAFRTHSVCARTLLSYGVTPCGLVKVRQLFRGVCCPHYPGGCTLMMRRGRLHGGMLP
jgi:hypothetical protein